MVKEISIGQEAMESLRLIIQDNLKRKNANQPQEMVVEVMIVNGVYNITGVIQDDKVSDVVEGHRLREPDISLRRTADIL